jgi:hypothetical protein
MYSHCVNTTRLAFSADGGLPSAHPAHSFLALNAPQFTFGNMPTFATH